MVDVWGAGTNKLIFQHLPSNAAVPHFERAPEYKYSVLRQFILQQPIPIIIECQIVLYRMRLYNCTVHYYAYV